MSKLSESLIAKQTGHRRPIIKPMNYLAVETNLTPLVGPDHHLQQYSVTATVAHYVQVDKSIPGALEHSMRIASRGIVREFFGEFMPEIDGMWHALANHDVEEAKKYLDQLEKRMFDV